MKEASPLRGTSLGRQMLRLFSLTNGLFLVLLILTLDYSIRQTTLDTGGKNLTQESVYFTTLLDADIENALADIRSLADNLDRFGLLKNQAELTTTLNRLQIDQPRFSWIGLADTQGKVLAATRDMLVNNSVATRPWFITGQVAPAIVDVHNAELLAKMLSEKPSDGPMRFIDVTSPVLDVRDHPVGVLGGHLYVSWLNERIDHYRQKIGHDFEVVIIGHEGDYRAGQKSLVEHMPDLKTLWRQQASSGFVQMHDPTRGDVLVAFAKHDLHSGAADQLDWMTLMVRPVQTVVADARHVRLLACGGVFGLAIASLLLMGWMLRRFNQPIKALMRAIEAVDRNGGQLLELQALPQEFDAIRANINGLLGTLKDRERRLEEALQQIRTSFTGITKNFPGVLFRLEDRSGGHYDFAYLSDSVSKYFDFPGEPPKAATDFFEQVLADPSPANLQSLFDSLGKWEPLDIVLETRGEGTQTRHMRFKGQPHLLADGRKCWDGVAIDVTDLVSAEQSAQAADVAKSRFLATMSHEIRTPLNGILGFAQVLRQETTDEQARQDIQKIIDTADTLTRILNDVLDFSKIEAGKMELESSPFNFADLTRNMRDIFQALATQQGIDFSLQLSGDCEQTLLGDSVRLRQIISNMTSNAIKFTPQGQVTLSIDVALQENQTATIRLRVEDTGIGMAPEQMQRLFQRFEQSDRSIARKFGGSGLGLAIVKGLVDAMGGDIQVESRLGQGSRFLLTLNFPIVQQQAAVAQTAQPTLTRPLKILVTDDVKANREVICRGLKRDGHSFTQAENGQEALLLAQRETFDLILMDLDMPVMGGLEAAREIRRDSLNRKTVIIALSGFAYDSDVQAVHDAGMNGHMAKPIQLKKLRDLLADTFEST